VLSILGLGGINPTVNERRSKAVFEANHIVLWFAFSIFQKMEVLASWRK
jgi:hypothetical protein